MRAFIPKYIHRISIARQRILNFIGVHPKLTGVIAGLGIAFVFSSMGRFFVHEVLATTSASLTYDTYSAATTTFQVDYIDKTPISSVPGYHTVYYPCSCSGCGASEFTPGQEASPSPGDAQNVAPGELAKSPGDASNFAPGELKKKGF